MTIVLDWPLDRQQSERLLEFCWRNGVDCFAVDFICWDEKQRNQIQTNFFNRLVPFSLGKRFLERTVWPAGQDRFHSTDCWSLNDDTIRLIFGACDGALSNYGNGRIPEDWRFYRNGELFLGFISHEQCAFLRLSNAEAERFRSLGISYVIQEVAL